MGLKVGSQQPGRAPTIVPRQLTPPNTNIRVARPQPETGRPRGLGASPSIRVRKADTTAGPAPLPRSAQANMLAQAQQDTQKQYQKMHQQAMAGNSPERVGVEACLQCGSKVTPRVDALTTHEGQYPLCPACWAHTWVSHKYRGITEGPPCSMGVRFKMSEKQAIESAIRDTIREVGSRAGRFPTAPEMNVVLSSFKFSQVCTTCKGNIAYNLTADDFPIPGVNRPWPPGAPVPWSQQQLSGPHRH